MPKIEECRTIHNEIFIFWKENLLAGDFRVVRNNNRSGMEKKTTKEKLPAKQIPTNATESWLGKDAIPVIIPDPKSHFAKF